MLVFLRKPVWQVGLFVLWALPVSAQNTASTSGALFSFNLLEISQLLDFNPQKSLQDLNQLIIQSRDKLLATYRVQLQQVLLELNQLRNPYYQYLTAKAARQMEGINLYHDYALGNENDDRNTCVTGWCLVMAQTGQYRLQDLATGRIQYFAGTLTKEAEKKKPNLQQRKPKYLNVNEVLEKSEALGFLPIDLDLAQRGDFCVQYYRKVRLREEFGAQHISIIDQIVPWGEGLWELRDWHEGIEGEPFLYRTGTSHSSSYNNVFTPQNIYFGFQLDRGKERALYTKNPNVCQAYGYFGDHLEAARTLIRQINYLRAQIYFIENIKPESLSLGTKP